MGIKSQKSRLRQGFGGQAKLPPSPRLRRAGKVLFVLFFIINYSRLSGIHDAAIAYTSQAASGQLLTINSNKAYAQEMNSQNFKIQGGNFNMTSGNKASTNFKLSDVVGQTASITFTSKGYIIQSGFLNSAAGAIFNFSVSPTTIDFGNLLPNIAVEKNITVKIGNGDVAGYVVKASENQALSTSTGATIVDTACDSEGMGPCTAKLANLWNKNSTYGFGYRMSGRTTPADFTKDGYYRPFAATGRNEQAEVIMQTKARKVTDTATMTLRINVGSNQPVGQYRNVISFTALAGI